MKTTKTIQLISIALTGLALMAIATKLDFTDNTTLVAQVVFALPILFTFIYSALLLTDKK